MKKYFIYLIIMFILIAPVSVFSKPSEEEAAKAFSISFQVYFSTSLLTVFGQTPEGATVSEELITFDNIDIAALKVDNPGSYTKMSGKIFLKNKNNIKAVLKLKGGNVKNLEWTIDNFDVKKDNTVVINADGRILNYSTSKM